MWVQLCKRHSGSGRMVIAADCKSVGLSFEVQFLSAAKKYLVQFKGIIKFSKIFDVGSIRLPLYNFPVAQLVEQLFDKQEVNGSIHSGVYHYPQLNWQSNRLLNGRLQVQPCRVEVKILFIPKKIFVIFLFYSVEIFKIKFIYIFLNILKYFL